MLKAETLLVTPETLKAAENAALECHVAVFNLHIELAMPPHDQSDCDRRCDKMEEAARVYCRACEAMPFNVLDYIVVANAGAGNLPGVTLAGEEHRTAHEAARRQLEIAICVPGIITADTESNLWDRLFVAMQSLRENGSGKQFGLVLRGIENSVAFWRDVSAFIRNGHLGLGLIDISTAIQRESAYAIANITRMMGTGPNNGADSANKSVRANTPKLFLGEPPENPDIRDLVSRLDAEAGKDPSEKRSGNEVAREFTGETKGESPRANSLLAQIRRLRNQGRINL